MPYFAHVSLILAPDRSKLSKRHGATSVGQVFLLIKYMYTCIQIYIYFVLEVWYEILPFAAFWATIPIEADPSQTPFDN